MKWLLIIGLAVALSGCGPKRETGPARPLVIVTPSQDKDTARFLATVKSLDVVPDPNPQGDSLVILNVDVLTSGAFSDHEFQYKLHGPPLADIAVGQRRRVTIKKNGTGWDLVSSNKVPID